MLWGKRELRENRRIDTHNTLLMGVNEVVFTREASKFMTILDSAVRHAIHTL